MSNIINKVKDAISSDKHSSSHSAPEGTAGPHNSRVANAADPRVDSDMDRSRNTGLRTAGHGEYGSSGIGNTHGSSSNTYGSSTGNTFGSSGTTEGSHGPHNSRLANAADPRVDSDRDGSNTMGRNTGGYGSHTTTGGLGGHSTGNTFGSSGTTEGSHGPHNSKIANAMDPRIDSDRDGSNTMGGTGGGLGSTGNNWGSSNTHHTHNTHSGGIGSGTTGMTGTHGASTGTHGPHGSRMANAADPRVDSDRDGRAGIGHSAPGPAHNTAGPHKSDMLNKVDPRVDSDLDGSKTMGGNKTYQSGSSGMMSHHRDPTDAAQAPPSVLREHIGDPVIEHDHKHHNRERRNSVKTSQETFSGI
ncbi:hypothetical protein B0H66DRAFT_599336 [Apodospora peruviana]|uniref:Cell surface protein n=1 Tax=Apodospora peruviana TaxID=516989 RepID=A0AAE0II54_9PEZI|nr:hypothetical protein B0H66DRAFT_599336 [Apodospora peruviana]